MKARRAQLPKHVVRLVNRAPEHYVANAPRAGDSREWVRAEDHEVGALAHLCGADVTGDAKRLRAGMPC